MKISFFSCSGDHYSARVKTQNLEVNIRNLIILGFYVRDVSLERASSKEVSRGAFFTLVSAYRLIGGKINSGRKGFVRKDFSLAAQRI